MYWQENKGEDQAFSALYEDLKSKLHLFSNNTTPSKQEAKEQKKTTKSSEQIIATMRKLIDDFPHDCADDPSNSLRKKLVSVFIEEFSQKFPKGEVEQSDLFIFLDCVLDKSCTTLDLHLPAWYANQQFDTTQLVKIVTRRCPLLTKVGFYLKNSTESFLEYCPRAIKPMTVPMETAFCKTLGQLENLTYINICWKSSDNTIPFFSSLGSFCPQMKTMDLAGFACGSEHLLALILGKWAQVVPVSAKEKMWGPFYQLSKNSKCSANYVRSLLLSFAKDFGEELTAASDRFDAMGVGKNQMHLFQFPAEYLSPICSSLEELYTDNHDESNCKSGDCLLRHPEYFIFAFRHLKRLRMLAQFCSAHHPSDSSEDEDEEGNSHHLSESPKLIRVVEYLHEKIQQPNNETPQLEETTGTGKSRDIPIKWTFNAPFPSSLAVVELDNVNILSRKTMQAVASLCPNLREISFIEKRTDQQDDLLSLAELQSILVAGPFKFLEEVTFLGVSTTNFNSVLAVLGSKLLKMSFRSCKDVDLGHFLPFLQLQVLNLDKDCTLSAGDVESIQTDTFLPNLKKLSTKICLGKSSRLFEEKSILNDLTLCCSHIGTESSCRYDTNNLEAFNS